MSSQLSRERFPAELSGETRLQREHLKMASITHLRIGVFLLPVWWAVSQTTLATEHLVSDLSDAITATLGVSTQNQEPVNNRLLGYNLLHTHTKKERDLVRRFNPIAIRFPDGAWSNFYDWETDTYTNHGDKNPRGKSFAKTLEAWKKMGRKGGFPGLTKLNVEKKQGEGKGYDIVWVYNVAYDSPAKNVARMKHSLYEGFDVRDIELGNEQFWKSQASSQTDTPDGFLRAARPIASALREAKPGIRVSIPLSWREQHAQYNRIAADDAEYFDAISLHKYVGTENDMTEEESDKVLRSVLSARLSLEEASRYVRSFAPGKPIWLTEWGVSAGKEAKAAAALAMADCYLYLFENQGIYDRANWFSVNGVSNSFLIFKVKRQLLYPLRKTAHASVYEIVRSVLENGQLLARTIEAEQLITPIGSIKAVNALAVARNGRITVLAVNLTDQACLLKLNIDDMPYDQTVLHEAMAFKDLSAVVVLDFEDNPLQPIGSKSGMIVLPPYSVNKISGIQDIFGSR